MMARSWRDYSGLDACDNSDKRDKSIPHGDAAAPNVPFVTNVEALPPDLVDGLKCLASLAAPRLRAPEVWPEVVNDARRLVAEGWAAKALGLGWSPLDLFGGVTDPDGDATADGLAVRLRGRPILALCSAFATVGSQSGTRTYLYRGNNIGARLLWEIGRGR